MIKQLIKNLSKFFKKNEEIDFEFYQKIRIFENLTNKEILKLNDILIEKSYQKDEVIYKENHPQVVIYVVKKGRVNLIVDLPHLQFKVFEIGPKNHFGEIGLFIDTPRIHTAIALEYTELIAIKKSDLKQFILVNPGTGVKLLFNFGKYVALKMLETSKIIRQNGIFE